MASLKHMTFIVPVLALSFFQPAMAQRSLDADDAALCSAALDLARGWPGMMISQHAKYVQASDWFQTQGIAANEIYFENQLELYIAALTEARDSGDSQFRTVVEGCETYYDTSRTD